MNSKNFTLFTLWHTSRNYLINGVVCVWTQLINKNYFKLIYLQHCNIHVYSSNWSDSLNKTANKFFKNRSKSSVKCTFTSRNLKTHIQEFTSEISTLLVLAHQIIYNLLHCCTSGKKHCLALAIL